jgi:glutathione synthase/RimK-type ligase-like ATP-grasp enzyme
MAADTPSRRSLLIVGGDADPNITALLSAAERDGVSFRKLLVGKSSHPSLTWNIDHGTLLLDGAPLDCSAAFVRHDVFTALQDGQASSQYRALAWHTAVTGWLAAHPEVFIFNRRNLNQVTNKPLVLKLAQDCGLQIPQTLITNDRDRLAAFLSDEPGVVKPINGGGYCEPLAEVLERTAVKESRMAAPAIVQQQLVPPEVRIYRIGDRYLAFNVISPDLDYRSSQNCRVEPIDVPGQIAERLGLLLARLGLDFAAADFKTCPEKRQLLFLEVNTGPMFAAFDHATNGALCRAMVQMLIRGNDAKDLMDAAGARTAVS